MQKPRSEPILTVVVPTYNASPYLDHCINSILEQGLADEELEIVVVNDGSTDGSELLAEKWSARHRNIRLVYQSNAGLSAARNTGFRHANGEFITFVDSDDVIPSGAYRRLLMQLMKSGSDFITSPAYRFTSRTRVAWPFNRNIDLFKISRTGVTLEENPEFMRDFTAWNKIYRREFFARSKVWFPEGRIYEDIATSPLLYHLAESFDVSSEVGYFWRVTPGGITQTIKPVKAIDRLWALEHIQAYFANQTVSKNVLDELGFAVLDYNLRWVFLEYYKFNDSTKELILEKSNALLKDVDDTVIDRVQSPISDWGLLAKRGQLTELNALLTDVQKVSDRTLEINSSRKAIRREERQARWKKRKREWRRQSSTRRRQLRNAAIYLVFRPLVKLLPVDSKRVVVSNYWGQKFSISDGPAAIGIELAKSSNRYRIVVFANGREYEEIVNRVRGILPPSGKVRVVQIDTLGYYYNLWRAKYLFNDVNFSIGFLTDKFVGKRSAQIEVQTTHGIPLKRMGIDSEQAIPEKERRKLLAKSQRYDYLVSSSPLVARIYANAHGVSPKILSTGLPQNDFLFKQRGAAELSALKQHYGLDPDKKVILYAPTFRNGPGYAFRYLIDFFELQKELGDDYQIVIKVHPFNHTHLGFIDFREITDFANAPEKHPFVKLFGEVRIDDRYVPAAVTQEEGTSSPEIVRVKGDINEMMFLSDLAITDYSSVMFNYAHLKKPLVLFTPDFEHYNSTRGSYFDIDSIAPGATAKSTRDIIEAVKRSEDSGAWALKYGERVANFHSTFLEWEKGQAARKILIELGLVDGERHQISGEHRVS